MIDELIVTVLPLLFWTVIVLLTLGTLALRQRSGLRVIWFAVRAWRRVVGRWMTRERVRQSRYGIALGSSSIGFHLGKRSAYRFPSKRSASRTGVKTLGRQRLSF